MFEFEDSKLGKIKVVNVTEARSAIASIMTDKEYNYVITKNNRPIRVIINFDIYKKSQLTAAKIAKTVETKNSLKGLLQTREDDLRNQPSPRVEELMSGKVPPPPSEPAIVSEMALEALPEPLVEEVEKTGDYFQRFKKLYEAPRQNPLPPSVFVKPDKPVTPPSIPFEDLPEPPEEEWASLPAVSSGPGRSATSDLPSIQDLLKELEDEKLSGEEEAPLDAEEVQKLLNRVS